MSSRNFKSTSIEGTTHQGGIARKSSPEQELRRSVMACLLWENNFYEDGESHAKRVADLVKRVDPKIVRDIAVETYEKGNLRHIGLHLMRELVRNPEGRKYSDALYNLCKDRPDQLGEFLSLYYTDKDLNPVNRKNGKYPLANGVKRALKKAFEGYSEYQIRRWLESNKNWSLKDVMFMLHPNPNKSRKEKVTKFERNENNYPDDLTPMEELYFHVAEGTARAPDTWEKRSSAGEDKKEMWEDMMRNNKLGTQAFVMNLRNMIEAGVDKKLMKEYSTTKRVDKMLPYQFVTAARENPTLIDLLEPMMFKSIEDIEKLSGTTTFLIDVSGSMGDNLSKRGTTQRIDAAAGLAILGKEICEDVEIFTFSNRVVQIPNYRGFALRDSILKSQPHSGTYLGQAINTIVANSRNRDRLIVLTDEQSSDRVDTPDFRKLYMLNVASYQPSVAYGKWHSISGWSGRILDYIREYEKM